MDWETQYGKLPFDQFVLSKWDYTRLVSQDHAQWNQLTRKWLALTPSERDYWYEASFSIGSAIPGDTRLPSQEQIDRLFVPHQTTQERSLSVLTAGRRTIWLRTCYAPELEDAYQDMFTGVAESTVRPENVLDNKDLYDFGEKWDRILERIPSLCDRDTDAVEVDDEAFRPKPEDPKLGLWNAAGREIVLVYMLDRQALMEKLVTAMWLDCYGECVWWYRIEVDDLETLTGWLSATAGLRGMLELAEGDDNGERMFEKGRLVDWLDF